MTQPAQAFAPGSPVSGSSIVSGALSSLLGGGGGLGMGVSGSSSSGGTSGDAAQGGSVLGGDMNVNYGDGATQGAGASTPWGMAALVAAGVAFIVKRFAP